MKSKTKLRLNTFRLTAGRQQAEFRDVETGFGLAVVKRDEQLVNNWPGTRAAHSRLPGFYVFSTKYAVPHASRKAYNQCH